MGKRQQQESREKPARRHPRGRSFVDYPRRGRRGLRRWLPSWRLVLGTVVLGVGALVGLFAWAYASVDIPDENAVAVQEANTYYWADGTQMVSLGKVNRNIVHLSDVPESVQNAVIAAENESFYSDPGVSLKGILRAAASTVEGQETQGGSTITQQYVKNTYLSQEQTLTRKAKEFIISLKLDRTKSKQDILQGYLNTSWFGRGAYGIEAAAHAYYGIPARQLDPGQGAALAALLKGAELYDPATSRANHERAEDRWKWILDREVEAGLMSQQERDKHRTFPEPDKQSMATNLAGQTGYLVDVANKYIKAHSMITDQDLAHGGYRIHTTFDKKQVEQLTASVESVLAKNIDPRNREADRNIQVGAASVRHSDGAVLALYGGPDATKQFTNNADTLGVPVGSAFKPFVLAAALQYGTERRDGDRTSVYSGDFYGNAGKLQSPSATAAPDGSHPSLRQALATGGNATYVRLGKEVGLEAVKDIAIRSGLLENSMAPLEDTFSVGTSTPSAIRMAGAYGTFANHGLQNDPYSVTKLVKDDESVGGFESRTKARRALPREVADEVGDVLREAGSKMFAGDTECAVGAPVAAGRTGDQDRLKSAWFVGWAKYISTAVTMFRMQPTDGKLLPMSDVGGDTGQRGNAFPAKIWGDYMDANPRGCTPAKAG
ncbi:transglycosylase domain-containing protein [Streptomyces sp. NPDC050485]|uniref:transglycosylase domain-containing protein n=1 Tax=Streptomyces sp. NPDC050485 TaxID=3365617 RepID=UPI0037A67A6B